MHKHRVALNLQCHGGGQQCHVIAGGAVGRKSRYEALERQQTAALALAFAGQVAHLLNVLAGGCAHIDRHEQVALGAHGAVERQRIDYASVDKHMVSHLDGLEHRRHGDARTYGAVETALAEHDFALCDEVGGYGPEGCGEVLYFGVGHHFFQGPHHLVALDKVALAQ